MNKTIEEFKIITEELNLRRAANPIDFFEPLSGQDEFLGDNSDIKIAFGGNRCIDGESLIYDPIKNKHLRAQDIDGNFHVQAWDGERVITAKAEKPFTKDTGPMYKVTMSDGKIFLASDTHHVLGPSGFVQVGELKIGSRLFSIDSDWMGNETVISIDYIGNRVKWDFTVPKYHNYIYGGCVHHNSGKSEIGSVDVLTLGLSKPNQRIWCDATTFADSVAIQQAKIWQYVPKHRIKYGQYSEITGFTNRKLQLDNGSLITFKSYDQGRESHQGDKLHMIWFDEEPPFDIYRECKMRLLDYNGKMIITMTSLKGVTDVIDELYQGADILKTKHASIVDEVLPIVAKKGNAKFFMLWTTDNKYVNQARLVDDVKLMTPQEIKARVYGIPTNLQGLIYPTFSKDIHVISSGNIDFSDCQLWNVLDPHDRKPWAIGWFAVNKSGQCVAIDEYPNKNFNEMLYDDKTYDDYVALIRQKESDMLQYMSNKYVKRVIDPNFGNSTVQLAERQGGQSKTTLKEELRKRGMHYDDGIDAIEDGHLKVREFLHYQIKDKQFVTAPKIYFSDKCENMIRHMSKYSRVDGNTKSGETKDTIRPAETHKDFCDITRYFSMANPRYIEVLPHVENKSKCY